MNVCVLNDVIWLQRITDAVIFADNPAFCKIPVCRDLHAECFCILLCRFQLLHTQHEDYGYFNNVGIGESMNT